MLKRLCKPFAYFTAVQYFIALIFLLALTTLSASSQEKITETEYAYCKSRIEKSHQMFYRLSFEPDYVKTVIMPSVIGGRSDVAPHFPKRQTDQNTDHLFKSWMETYPNEYKSYILYLMDQLEIWRIASPRSTKN